MRFVSQMTLPPALPRFAPPEAGRPRVFLRQAQDKLTLRRTVKVRLRSESLRLPGGTAIFMISRRRLVHIAG
jgi:hypothetical protein